MRWADDPSPAEVADAEAICAAHGLTWAEAMRIACHARRRSPLDRRWQEPAKWRRARVLAAEAWADVEACAEVLAMLGVPGDRAVQVVLALRAHALGWDAWDAAGEYVAGLDLPACMG